jgi:hypothetical protein
MPTKVQEEIESLKRIACFGEVVYEKSLMGYEFLEVITTNGIYQELKTVASKYNNIAAPTSKTIGAYVGRKYAKSKPKPWGYDYTGPQVVEEKADPEDVWMDDKGAFHYGEKPKKIGPATRSRSGRIPYPGSIGYPNKPRKKKRKPRNLKVEKSKDDKVDTTTTVGTGWAYDYYGHWSDE